MARASVQLSQFKFKVTHLAGKRNSAADAISRTENLPTDQLTAESINRHDEDEILDLQLTDGNPDEIRSCDGRQERQFSNRLAKCVYKY